MIKYNNVMALVSSSRSFQTSPAYPAQHVGTNQPLQLPYVG